MSESDLELLKRYVRDHAEEAFAEVVRRQLDFVYSAALRQVHSPQLAEEVAQSAFIDLARSAARLKPDTILTAWLYEVTRRTAIDVVRREARRQLREHRDGMRGYLLVTPLIRQADTAPDAEQVVVQSQVIGAPESFWTQIGWGTARSETRRSTLAGVLTSEQVETLVQLLKETQNAELSNSSLAKCRDGEYIGIGFAMSDDNEAGALMGLDVYPRIAPDGRSVDLEMRPAPVSTNTQIHASLKPAKNSASRATR